MAKKRVWVSWLPGIDTGSEMAGVLQALAGSGLDAKGAPWTDDLGRMAWVEVAAYLLDEKVADAWLVAGRQEEFAATSMRYGIALASAMLRADRKTPLPTLCLGLDFQPEQPALPPLLSHCRCIRAQGSAWAAQVVAALFKPFAPTPPAFRFNVIAHPSIGQWFEVGPEADERWDGVLFGVHGTAQITHHGIGVRGQLPETCVLEYPSQGIQARLGDDTFTCWAVKNCLDRSLSYYVRVKDYPSRVLFGDNAEGDAADFHVLRVI